jgi:peptide/nickel transport system ATP-binding protein
VLPAIEQKLLLKIDDLCVEFKTPQPIKAVDGVDIDIREGEILGLVGESGSGKSVLSLSLLRLIGHPGRITRGAIYWRGNNLQQLDEKDIQAIRGKEMAMIFQNPQASLNPVRTVRAHFVPLLRLHHNMTVPKAENQAVSLLRDVGIPDPERVMGSYAHQLSGGLCQRVMIAMAISCRPKLLIADEPTASLDTTIQAQIIDLLLELRDRLGMAILLVSHDLGVIARLCDRVAVMYLGRIVEIADATALYDAPQHPYTRMLLQSVAVPDPRQKERKSGIQFGDISQSRTIIPGTCRFQGRCSVAVERCRQTDPKLVKAKGNGHWIACIHNEH